MFNYGSLLIILALLQLSGLKQDSGVGEENTNAKEAIIWTVGWSMNDSLIASGNDQGQLNIYETSGWKKVKSWTYDSATITRVEWNPKYLILAIASVSHADNNNVIHLFDCRNGNATVLGKSLQGRGLSWSANGEQIAFVGSQGSINIFSKEGHHQKTLSFRNEGSLFDIDWHPTKDILLAVEEDIFIIDISKDSLLQKIDDGSGHKGILCCQWHTSGNFFITGDYGSEAQGGEPSYLKYWSDKGKLIKSIKESKYEYRNARWRKDGKYLAAAADVLIVLNEKGDVTAKKKISTSNLWGIDWSNKGDRILVSDQAGTIFITTRQGIVLQSFKE